MLPLAAVVVSFTLAARAMRPLWPRSAAWLRDLASQSFGRGILAILGGRLRVIGDAPKPPYVLVSNHLGYLDVVVLLAVLERPRFVSRADVRQWPLFGLLARAGGTIFLARERTRELPLAVQAMVAALLAGDGVLFFPESTSSQGAGLLPFRTALFSSVAIARVPLHCASLRFSSGDAKRPAGEWLCWAGEKALLPHMLGVLGAAGFEAELRFAPEALDGDDRKALARAARDGVASVFVPTSDPPDDSAHLIGAAASSKLQA